MTDRFDSLTVVLERDTREDDAEAIIQAIRMIKGVLSVKPHVADLQTHIAQERVRREITEKIWQVVQK